MIYVKFKTKIITLRAKYFLTCNFSKIKSLFNSSIHSLFIIYMYLLRLREIAWFCDRETDDRSRG
jgi:hypothetical protein